MKRNLVLALLPLATSACLASPKLDPTYCGNNEGDRFCADLDPSKPYCVLATDDCYEANGLGLEGSSCVTELPAQECRNECGVDDAGCMDPTETTVADTGSSTGTGPTTETDPTSETETTGPTSETETTGPTGCQGPDDCTDSALPFCVDEVCVACSAAAEPDAACAELDAGFPLCVGDSCVQCSAEDASVCADTTPLCDDEANTCVACEFHEQCQDIGSPACNFVTGACFDPDAVTTVSLASSGALQAAIDGVDDGTEHAIIVTGSAGVSHNATVDGGKTIAFVSTNTSTQTLAGLAGNPTLTLSGAGTTVFLHRLELTANTDDVGISVEASAALFADSTQVSQNSGGGITLAAGTSAQLRNCMVAGEGGDPGIPAISSNGAELDLLYSTLGLDFNNGGPTLECSGGAVTIRNSIVASDSGVAGSASQCPGADVENSLVDNDSSADAWFEDMSAGDYSLTAAGQTQFANIAVWETSDPPFDFEGDARPAVDGSPDFPGADTIP